MQNHADVVRRAVLIFGRRVQTLSTATTMLAGNALAKVWQVQSLQTTFCWCSMLESLWIRLSLSGSGKSWERCIATNWQAKLLFCCPPQTLQQDGPTDDIWNIKRIEILGCFDFMPALHFVNSSQSKLNFDYLDHFNMYCDIISHDGKFCYSNLIKLA